MDYYTIYLRVQLAGKTKRVNTQQTEWSLRRLNNQNQATDGERGFSFRTGHVTVAFSADWSYTMSPFFTADWISLEFASVLTTGRDHVTEHSHWLALLFFNFFLKFKLSMAAEAQDVWRQENGWTQMKCEACIPFRMSC